MTGPECSTCTRPDVGDIHRALDAGESKRAVAKKYGIHEATLRLHLRHRAAVPNLGAQPGPGRARTMSKAPEAPTPLPSRPGANGSEPGAIPLHDLERRVVQLADTADRFRAEVEDSALTPRERGSSLGQAVAAVKAMMELAEKLQEGRESKIVATPEWSALKERIMELLGPFPDARKVLEDGLREEAAA